MVDCWGMSRHSKWSKIKHQKGAADVKKGAIFTKHSKAITIAAQDGADASMNFKLRLALEAAKAAGMTKDTIDRAVARGTGEGKEGVQMIEELFEGFLPGGIAVMVEAVTDNHNRTLQEVKHIFTKSGGALAGANAVAWMFEKKGVIRVGEVVSSDELELVLIEAGAQDIASEEGGLTIYTKVEDLKSVEEKVRNLSFTPEYVGFSWIPKERVAPMVDMEAIDGALAMLEEHDDVSNVYTNLAE